LKWLVYSARPTTGQQVLRRLRTGLKPPACDPYDDQKFTDDDFHAANVTDEPLPTSSAVTAGIDQQNIEQNYNHFCNKITMPSLVLTALGVLHMLLVLQCLQFPVKMF